MEDRIMTLEETYNVLKTMDAPEEHQPLVDMLIEMIRTKLEEAGFDHAVAIATEAEIAQGAACGQLSIITENNSN